MQTETNRYDYLIELYLKDLFYFSDAELKEEALLSGNHPATVEGLSRSRLYDVCVATHKDKLKFANTEENRRRIKAVGFIHRMLMDEWERGDSLLTNSAPTREKAWIIFNEIMEIMKS